MRAILAVLLASATVVGAGAPVRAADAAGGDQGALGKRVYGTHCAVCHGTDGTGTGPYAELLTTALPDLTRLSARNDGVFPHERIRQVIDGRADVGAHGSRDMPIWGEAFSRAAIDHYQDYYTRAQAEAFVNGRILAVMDYLQTLQQ
ncbi:cytochrome c family protein, putative [Caenispirillum salinarum AK4]|uniref:Cytochrome c family protein, putative n=1 Tax=Caenispirillum salinarum AK4 TaxID=1238182 RepID=K9H202_9PROT|nr:c-type cytochrome [Caenispirillum salinarum]EKV32300.1 cytochrome c family protein, putative [Caenispirillum salinarum AK4]